MKSINLLNNNKLDKLTFVDILLHRVKNNPNKKAFTFINNEGNLVLTYSELDKKIQKLAVKLQDMGLEGERVLLLFPPGFDYIIGYFACLYAGVIAVPVYPPDPSSLKRTLPRLQSIVIDSKAKLALSVKDIIDDVKNWNDNLNKEFDLPGEDIFQEKTKSYAEEFKEIFNLKWLAADNLEEDQIDSWKFPQITPKTIAYLQYTSGSTGSPKGVIITHENLVHNTNMILKGFGLEDEEYEGVIWLPIYHDMGLVGGILEPIFAGFHCNLLSPIDFLKRPLRWLQIISDIKEKSIVSGGPNFAYDLCLRATNQQKRESLDLSNWKVAFTGAEPVRAETIEEFSNAFEVSGFKKKAFYPCFGLAEGTLIVTGGDSKKEPVKMVIDKEELKNNNIIKIKDEIKKGICYVSSGKSILDGIVKIVNPENSKTCNDYEVGEVWSLSKSNAQGYWEKPEATKDIFHAFTSDTNDGPFLRTGDLGFMVNGELFVTGRLKDLIIIRGSNHYPQDIETTVENSNSLLRQGNVAAFSVDIDNEEQLVIVQEARAKKNVNWNEVIESIKEAVLKTHNIQPYSIVLIQPKTIFKTSSGKIQRSATKKAFCDNKLNIVHKWSKENPFEAAEINNKKSNAEEKNSQSRVTKSEVTNIIVGKLAKELKLTSEQINKDTPFVNYGLDSAKSVQLVGELEEIVGRTLESTILWSYPTINKLSEYLANGSGANLHTANKIEEKDKEPFNDMVKKLSEDEAKELLLKKLGIDK